MDLLGCGDSSGDFGDATWAEWVTDIRTGISWLQRKFDCPPVLWGLRLGCLLCLQAAAEVLTSPTLIFWQPVIAGRQHLDQFLRLAVLSDIVVEGDRKPARVQRLREELVSGKAVEVAGYTVSPALAAGIDGAELIPGTASSRMAWLEVLGSGNEQIKPGSQMCVDQLQRTGYRVETRVVPGAPFWQVNEVGDCSQLVDATLEVLEHLDEHL